MQFELTREFATEADANDPLKDYRDMFHYPTNNGEKTIYFCGNSLGIQPKCTSEYLSQEMHKWRNLGVEGHEKGDKPWFEYHKLGKKALSELVGASEDEVVAMNNLTTNLHLLMVSFYRPSNQRFKILIEGGAFPSDQYTVESQVVFHGYDPNEAIIEVMPRNGEHCLRTSDIIEKINRHGDSIALVLLSGIQYYTGQFFDMEKITQAAHSVGAMAGYDLAHAVGNVPLKLHDWEVDFAVWCSYKYLNSGPGSVGGAYVHEKYAENQNIPRFAGWWGHDEKRRFLMEKGFSPMKGVDGWQLSNVSILSNAAHIAALSITEKAGIEAIRTKSKLLTGYLEFGIKQVCEDGFPVEIITPANVEERGAQLSLNVKEDGTSFFNLLHESGIVVDWREPNVIRVAPAPLYNRFEEVYKFIDVLKRYSAKIQQNETKPGK